MNVILLLYIFKCDLFLYEAKIEMFYARVITKNMVSYSDTSRIFVRDTFKNVFCYIYI